MTEREADSFEIFETLASIAGEEAAWEICTRFAGESVTFPKTILRLKRNYDIRQEFKDGKSYRELSIKYALTTRQIRGIVHHPSTQETNARQLSLFEALS